MQIDNHCFSKFFFVYGQDGTYLPVHSGHQNGTNSRKSPISASEITRNSTIIHDNKKPRNRCNQHVTRFQFGGEREIRTLGTFDSSHDFQSCALDQLSHLSMTIVSITACVICKPALKLYLLWEQLSMLFFDVDYL